MSASRDLGREIERLAAKATPGPFDSMPGYLIRAIRGDVAVPLFETREIYDPLRAPTVRDSRGKVQFRAGSHDAQVSRSERQKHANTQLVALLLNNVPLILQALAEKAAR